MKKPVHAKGLRHDWSRSWAPANNRSRRQGRLTAIVPLIDGGALFCEVLRGEWSVRLHRGPHDQVLAAGSHQGSLIDGAREAEVSIRAIELKDEYYSQKREEA